MVFLTVLKILGITAGAVIALALLLILAVMLIPFRYSLGGAGTAEDISAGAAVRWLLGAVKFRLGYEEKKLFYSLRIFGIKVLYKDLTPEKIEEIILPKPDKETEKKRKKVIKSLKKKGYIRKEKKEEISFNERVDRICKGIKEKYARLLDIKKKIETVKYIIGAPVTARAVATVKRYLFRILGSIRPRSLKGWARFGTGDPAKTAQLYGALAVITGMIDERFVLTPDMEESVIDIDGEINGRIIAGYVVICALKIIADKNVRRVISYTRRNL